jgi:hypothetical protein
MAKTDKEPFGKKAKAKPTGRLSSPLNTVKKTKAKPSVSLSGGLQTNKKGIGGGFGGNLNIPVVRNKKASLDVNISGGVGGFKPKGGQLSGGGSGKVGISYKRTIGSKKSNKPKR